MPVKARTSEVLPWSICPAVPATTCFMRSLLIVLLALIAPPSPAQGPASDPAVTFKTGVSDVRVDVQALDGTRPIGDLSKGDFAVFDSGMVQPLTYFGHDLEPVALGLLLDVSGSMQPRLEELAARAREALDLLRPGDRVAILVFGRRTEVHREFSDNLAETARQIGLAVRGHDVGAGTAINSAVVEAANYLRDHPAAREGRKAVLIVTDNLSLNYKIPDERVVAALDEAGAVLDAIVTGRGIRPKPPTPGVYANPDFTPADVFHLAEATGGEAVKSEKTGAALRDMVEAIRERYTLSYKLPEGRPGTYRRIEVRLTAAALERYPNAVLRYRTGYRVPES